MIESNPDCDDIELLIEKLGKAKMKAKKYHTCYNEIKKGAG